MNKSDLNRAYALNKQNSSIHTAKNDIDRFSGMITTAHIRISAVPSCNGGSDIFVRDVSKEEMDLLKIFLTDMLDKRIIKNDEKLEQLGIKLHV